MSSIWFDGWSGVGRVLVVGVAAYAALVVMLRVSGKRTLSKLNAFDLVVTMALGSTLATVLLSRDVAFAEGLTAFAVLICSQFAVSWLSVHSSGFKKLIRSQPRILVWNGQMLKPDMRRERITVAEVEAAVRGAGLASLEQARVVVLETDGSLHVIESMEAGCSALSGVKGDRKGGAVGEPA
jgi:uncharacterized membrane protein YcaP (DUF421 family)